MKTFKPLFLMAIVLAGACQKETVTPVGSSPLETAITGSWQVITDGGTPASTEWSGFYVGYGNH